MFSYLEEGRYKFTFNDFLDIVLGEKEREQGRANVRYDIFRNVVVERRKDLARFPGGGEYDGQHIWVILAHNDDDRLGVETIFFIQVES